MKNIILTLILLIFNKVIAQKIDYKKFQGKSSKIFIFKEYEYANLYDYRLNSKQMDSVIVKINKGTEPENLLSLKFNKDLKKNKDSITFKLHLLTRLKIDINNQQYTLISFKTSDKPKINVINYIFKNKNWSENINKNKELNYLNSILKYSNANIIFEFYNDTNNPNYPEINKLKPLVKDANGVLNIEKLAKVIEENKSSLAKYLD